MRFHRFTIYALYFEFSISNIQCLKMVSMIKTCSMLMGLMKFVAADNNKNSSFSYDKPKQDKFYKG